MHACLRAGAIRYNHVITLGRDALIASEELFSPSCRHVQSRAPRNAASLTRALSNTTSLRRVGPLTVDEASVREVVKPGDCGRIHVEQVTEAKSNSSNQLRPPLATLLPASNAQHSDLNSFLAHARRTGLNPSVQTFLGTRYEYLAQDALARVGFELLRTGKSGDRGVDLAGWWHLPDADDTQRLRALVQCKRLKGKAKLTPATIRELEGSFLGAPAGWRGDDVLGIIVSTRPATKGMITALSSSKRGLVWVCLEELEGQAQDGAESTSSDGTVDSSAGLGQGEESNETEQQAYDAVPSRIIQVLYNQQARRLGLEGLDVVKRHGVADDETGAVVDGVALVHRGYTVHPFQQSRSS